jgi:tetratricopeptide (TPR) repeat protein
VFFVCASFCTGSCSKEKEETKRDEIIEDILDILMLEITDPQEVSRDDLIRVRKYMFKDERKGYIEADRIYKMALINDPENHKVCADWVQNRALMDRNQGSVVQRKVALDLVDYMIEKHKKNQPLLRAKAYLLYSLGNLKEAQTFAQEALMLNGEDAESQLILGSSSIIVDGEKAIELIEGALEKNPEFNIGYPLLAEAYTRQAKFHAGIKKLAARQKKQPGRVELLESMAGIYMQVGQYKKAEKIYKKIMKKGVYRNDAIINLARIYTQASNNPRKSIKLLDQVLQEAGNDPLIDISRLTTEKSIALRIDGQVEQALKEAQKAIESDAIYHPALYAKAMAEKESDDVFNALENFKKLSVHVADSSRLWANMAEMYSKVPNMNKAIKSLKQALKISPADIDINLMMIGLYLDMDSRDLFVSKLKEVVTIDPLFDIGQAGMTPYYDGPTFLDLTRERFQKVAEREDEDSNIQALCGLVFFRSGKYKDAEFYLKRALDLDPDCFAAHLYLGTLSIARKRTPLALSHLKKAAEQEPKNITVARLMARALLKKGRANQAKKQFEKVLEHDPLDTLAQLGLAEVYLKKKKRKKAKEMLLAVFEKDKDIQKTKRLLFDLKH